MRHSEPALPRALVTVGLRQTIWSQILHYTVESVGWVVGCLHAYRIRRD
jgi:hypothetical protein